MLLTLFIYGATAKIRLLGDVSVKKQSRQLLQELFPHPFTLWKNWRPPIKSYENQKIKKSSIFRCIVRIDAKASAWRHIVDDIHIALVQLKIKYLSVFNNAVFVGGFGQRNNNCEVFGKLASNPLSCNWNPIFFEHRLKISTISFSDFIYLSDGFWMKE